MRRRLESSGRSAPRYFFFLPLALSEALDLVFAALRKPGRAAASVGRVKADGGAVVDRGAGVAGAVASVSSDMPRL